METLQKKGVFIKNKIVLAFALALVIPTFGCGTTPEKVGEKIQITIVGTNAVVNETQLFAQQTTPPPVAAQPAPPHHKQAEPECKKLPPHFVPSPHQPKHEHGHQPQFQQQQSRQFFQNGVTVTVEKLNEYKCSGCQAIFIPTAVEPHCPHCCAGKCRVVVQQQTQVQVYTYNPFMVQLPTMVETPRYYVAPQSVVVMPQQQIIQQQMVPVPQPQYQAYPAYAPAYYPSYDTPPLRSSGYGYGFYPR